MRKCITVFANSGTKYFRLAFPPGSEILDIGAGSDRNLGILIREKYEAYGAEPPSNEAACGGSPDVLGNAHTVRYDEQEGIPCLC